MSTPSMADDAHERLSHPASKALLYSTYCIFLTVGVVAGFAFRKKGEYFGGHSNRNGLLLALNFLATGLGSTVLTSYPQAAAFAGLQGVLVYALSTSLPLFAFAWLGPLVRRTMPTGFVFTEWVFKRYGISCGILFSSLTILTIYLFTCSELSNMRDGIEAITGMSGVPVMIVEAGFVAIYLAQGGFSTSFFTDNIQAATFLLLIGIATIAMGLNFHIDPELVTGMNSNLMGWKMVYFMPVEAFTNDLLLAGFWMRTFAARNEQQLFVGCSIAAVLLFLICSISGVAGLLAIWSGIVDVNSPNIYLESQMAFFDVLLPMPNWVHGIVLVLLVSLSICTFDSYMSSLVTTIANDLFRNRLRMIHVRVLTFVLMVPIVFLALKSPNILSICDLVAVAIIPTLLLGLSEHVYFLSGLEVILGFVFGILAVFIYGSAYYGGAVGGGNLIVLNNNYGIYANDWGPFGIFVVAPIGSWIGCLFGFLLRFLYFWRQKGRANAIFDRRERHWDHRFWEQIRKIWEEQQPKLWQAVHWFFLEPANERSGNTPPPDNISESDSVSRAGK